jgi:hypothetical protein
MVAVARPPAASAPAPSAPPEGGGAGDVVDVEPAGEGEGS